MGCLVDAKHFQYNTSTSDLKDEEVLTSKYCAHAIKMYLCALFTIPGSISVQYTRLSLVRARAGFDSPPGSFFIVNHTSRDHK